VYIVAIHGGSLAVAAIFLVNGLRTNGYNPSREHHLFAITFLFRPHRRQTEEQGDNGELREARKRL
jgi:hypothetical protein